MGDETRRFLRDYLRDDGRSAIQPASINDIFARCETDKGRAKTHDAPDKKETKSDEIVIPNRMRRWAADLSRVRSIFVPGQEMDSVFPNEFLRFLGKTAHSFFLWFLRLGISRGLFLCNLTKGLLSVGWEVFSAVSLRVVRIRFLYRRGSLI